jgi:dCMP deaminase
MKYGINKFIKLYADIAEQVSELSHARRLRVGAVIVKDDRILSYGYNGMPKGFDNNCEDEIAKEEECFLDVGGPPYILKRISYVTKPEVIHAEINAIAKVAASNDSTKGATIFITHAPCADCAKMIIASGIETVYYAFKYRDETGINILKSAKINVTQTPPYKFVVTEDLSAVQDFLKMP